MKRSGELWLSALIVVLALSAHLTGLLVPSIYRDPAIVLPARVLAGVMLVRDRSWGYVLAGTLLVKATTIALWVGAMIWLSARQGCTAPAVYTGFFVLLAGVGGVLAWRFTAADASLG